MISIPIFNFNPAESLKLYGREYTAKVRSLSKELCYAFGKMSKVSLFKMSFQILKEAVENTWDHKVNMGKDLLKSSFKEFLGVREKTRKYKKNGIVTELKNDSVIIRKKVKRNFFRAKSNLCCFYNLSFRQKKVFLKDMVTYVIFFIPVMLLVAGGVNLEGGAPDVDMRIGKMFGKGLFGWHRNVISHTILLGFGIEVLIRAASGIVRKVYGHLPENHDKIWDNINKIMPSAESASIAGAWMGIAVHLLKDSALLSGGYDAKIKTCVGMPFSMADDMHQSMFAVNGLLAGGISVGRKK